LPELVLSITIINAAPSYDIILMTLEASFTIVMFIGQATGVSEPKGCLGWYVLIYQIQFTFSGSSFRVVIFKTSMKNTYCLFQIKFIT